MLPNGGSPRVVIWAVLNLSGPCRPKTMTSNFRELPDPVDYLNDAKVMLSPHKSKLRLFLQDVDRLTQYLRCDFPS